MNLLKKMEEGLKRKRRNRDGVVEGEEKKMKQEKKKSPKG